MKHLLIVYGTTEGHTGKVAQFVGETLRGLGAHVDVMNASANSTDPNPAVYDATIVAASLHAGGYQRAVRRWVSRHAIALDLKPSMFLSVCLGVLEKNLETDRNLAMLMEHFFQETGWRPTAEAFIAGALSYTKYNWLKRWIMVRIARRALGNTDTSRDHEYTDWDDLKAFTREFYFTELAPMALTG